MDSLRKSILALILYFGVVFNIQRFDNLNGGEAGIMTFVYFLIVAAALLPLLLPFLIKYSVYYLAAFWVVVYLTLRITIFDLRPLFGGLAFYLSIAEMALLVLAVMLGYIVEERLSRYEHLFERITFSELEQHRILSMNQATDEIKTEFLRSRRHNHPLTAMVIETCSDELQKDLRRTLQEIQSLMARRYISAGVAKVIVDQARRTDVVIEDRKRNRFVLLCPETDAAGSRVLAERIEALIEQQLGLDITWGAASFPTDALTFDDLLSAAEHQMGQNLTVVFPTGTIAQGEEIRAGNGPD